MVALSLPNADKADHTHRHRHCLFGLHPARRDGHVDSKQRWGWTATMTKKVTAIPVLTERLPTGAVAQRYGKSALRFENATMGKPFVAVNTYRLPSRYCD